MTSPLKHILDYFLNLNSTLDTSSLSLPYKMQDRSTSWKGRFVFLIISPQELKMCAVVMGVMLYVLHPKSITELAVASLITGSGIIGAKTGFRIIKVAIMEAKTQKNDEDTLLMQEETLLMLIVSLATGLFSTACLMAGILALQLTSTPKQSGFSGIRGLTDIVSGGLTKITAVTLTTTPLAVMTGMVSRGVYGLGSKALNVFKKTHH